MTFFDRQFQHFILLLLLITALFYIADLDAGVYAGKLWGMKTIYWFWITVSVPIVHQIFVWISWRLQIHYQFLTRELGKKAFRFYTVMFFLIFGSRMVYLIFLSVSNKDTLVIDQNVQYALIIMITLVAAYAFYSVKRYFGMDRAAGLDHFDDSLVDKPFVKKGIFKYTNNGMYTYAFLIFYLPALIMLSKAALYVALFSHLYIWVHYYCTEIPDMKFIYQKKK